MPGTPLLPTKLLIEASSFCQLRCPVCPTTKGLVGQGIRQGTLTVPTFLAILRNSPGVREVELSNYGEVFLNKDLATILRIAWERGVTTCLMNGVNLNHASDAQLEACVLYRVRHIVVAIDGTDSRTYSTYRVRGSLDAVLAHVRALNHYKALHRSPYPELTWQFIVFGHNQHQIADARAKAADLNMRFVTKVNWDPGYSPVADWEPVRSAARSPVVTHQDQRDQAMAGEVQTYCGQLWRSPQINFDGRVLGCCVNHWGHFGGNLAEEPLGAVYAHERFRQAREALTGEQPMPADMPCINCHLWSWMVETGYRYRPDTG
jgi:MoaA/NifB/PqqE/SkfB family radical SAM enzyme